MSKLKAAATLFSADLGSGYLCYRINDEKSVGGFLFGSFVSGTVLSSLPAVISNITDQFINKKYIDDKHLQYGLTELEAICISYGLIKSFNIGLTKDELFAFDLNPKSILAKLTALSIIVKPALVKFICDEDSSELEKACEIDLTESQSFFAEDN